MTDSPAPDPSEPNPTPAKRQTRNALTLPLRWLFILLRAVILFLLLAWAGLAIHFSNLPWAGVRTALGIGFFVFGIWAIWISRGRTAKWIFAGSYAALLIWWNTIQPSHDRNWRSDVAILPRATLVGDVLRISNFRNFEYRSREDYTIRYEEREFDLSRLTSVDFYVSYWKIGPVGHTFVSFNFDNSEPLCISIETRPEVGEGFDPLASVFKQFELIYVVGDERDIVGVRTTHREEDVFLYRIRTTPGKARTFLLAYIERINQLHDQPEFYHLLKNNCTLNIVRYANAAGRTGRFDFRHLLNGWIDQYLYHAGFLASDLPFAELRDKSHINEVSIAADGAPDFPKRIRAFLPPAVPPLPTLD